jgi:heterotetrameric sarcosine oxidase delta subunit
MIVIRCPYCHELRTEEELSYGGEGNVARPEPTRTSDAEWTDYLFMRTNPKGCTRSSGVARPAAANGSRSPDIQ